MIIYFYFRSFNTPYLSFYRFIELNFFAFQHLYFIFHVFVFEMGVHTTSCISCFVCLSCNTTSSYAFSSVLCISHPNLVFLWWETFFHILWSWHKCSNIIWHVFIRSEIILHVDCCKLAFIQISWKESSLLTHHVSNGKHLF